MTSVKRAKSSEPEPAQVAVTPAATAETPLRYMRKSDLESELKARVIRIPPGATVPELRALVKQAREASATLATKSETAVPDTMKGWAAKNKATIVRKLLAIGEDKATLEMSKGELLLMLRTRVESEHPPTPTESELLSFGRYPKKTYQWVWDNDRGYCDWAVLTLLEEVTPGSHLKKFAEWVLWMEANATPTEEGTEATSSGTLPRRQMRPTRGSRSDSSEWSDVGSRPTTKPEKKK